MWFLSVPVRSGVLVDRWSGRGAAGLGGDGIGSGPVSVERHQNHRPELDRQPAAQEVSVRPELTLFNEHILFLSQRRVS